MATIFVLFSVQNGWHRESDIKINQTENDEPDATIVATFVLYKNNTEQKSRKLCFDAIVSRSEKVFMSQMISISFLLSFCI